jgi:membrane protease YdiL (CAAX protease family)
MAVHPGSLPAQSGDTARQPEWPAWYAPVAFVVAFAASLFVFVVIGAFAAALGANVDNPGPTLTVIGTVVQDAMLVIVAVIFASRVARPRLWQFGLRPARFWNTVGMSAAALFTYYAFVGIYSALVKPHGEQTVTQDLGASSSTARMVIAGILVIAIAPVAEEVFFRGFFYKALRSRFGIVSAALIDGAVFGVIHYTGSGTLEILPILAALGFIFCLLYERTGTLFSTIALHAINNTIAYAASTDGAVGFSIALGAVVVAGCMIVPRYLDRGSPAAVPT